MAPGQLRAASGWLLLRPVDRSEYITNSPSAVSSADICLNCSGENVQQVYLVVGGFSGGLCGE